MVHLIEQVTLAEDMPRLAQVGDLLLIDFFDCHGLVCVFICCEDDAPVGALAKDLAHVVIVEICLSRRAGIHAAARATIHARASCFNHVFAVTCVVSLFVMPCFCRSVLCLFDQIYLDVELYFDLLF